MDEPVFTKSYKLGSSYQVGFSPDGASLATISRNVTVWEAARHKRIASAHPFSHPSDFSFTPDGHQLVVKNTRGESVLLDASTLELIRDLGGYRLGEGTGPIAVDNEVVVEGSWSGFLFARSTSTNEITFQEHHPDSMVSDLVATPDRRVFAYQVSLKGEDLRTRVFVRRWPFAANAPIEMVRDRHVDGLGLDDRGRLAVGSGTQIEVLSISTGEVLASRDIGEWGSGAVWSPGGHELVVIGHGSVTGYTPELEPRWRIELQYASSVAFSPDGVRMAIGGWESGVVGIRAT